MAEIRALEPGELDAFIDADARAFGSAVDDAAREDARDWLEPERGLVAVEQGRLVGGAATITLRLTVPGGAQVPVAGVTWVSVLSTQRRRGVLRALMQHQLDSYQNSGEPLAALGASESGIYSRFGYGMASRNAPISVDRAHAVLLDTTTPAGTLEFVDTETVMREGPALYGRVAATQNGMFSRRPQDWRNKLRRAGTGLKGRSPLYMLLHRDAAGEVDGYCAYRIAEHWEEPQELAANTVHLSELLTATPEAYRACWQHLFNLDLVAQIVATRRPLEEPLDFMLRDPRRLRRTLRDDFHVRLVDIPAALSARRYGHDGELTLEVRDGFRPQNSGRYVLQGGLDGATCAATGRAAQLSVDVVALGAAYLGDTPLTVLAAAGLAEEHEAGALRRAAAMFSWPEPPFSPDMF